MASSLHRPLVFTVHASVLIAQLIFAEQLPSDKCPCYVMSNGKCLSYDSRYLAADLEEAIISFPDLSLMNPPSPVDEHSHTDTHHDHCVTEECRVCQQEIRQRLNEIGLSTPMVPNASSTLSSVSCSRYSFCQHGHIHEAGDVSGGSAETDDHNQGSDPYDREHQPQPPSPPMSGSTEHQPPPPPPPMSGSTCANCGGSVDSHMHAAHHEPGGPHGAGMSSPYAASNNGSDGGNGSGNWGRDEHRRRRQTAEKILGIRFNISCTAKATPLDVVGSVSLCSSCWAWRQLPAEYFPRFVNELICDDRDDVCLSGYAKCEPGLRTQEVMRNVSGTLIAVTLTSGTYCECKVQQSSALYGLVAGDGTSATLPPVSFTGPRRKRRKASER